MNGVRPGSPGRLEQALRRRNICWSQRHGFVGKVRVRRIFLDVRVDGHRLDT